jgi:hypothetical protein
VRHDITQHQALDVYIGNDVMRCTLNSNAASCCNACAAAGIVADVIQAYDAQSIHRESKARVSTRYMFVLETYTATP